MIGLLAAVIDVPDWAPALASMLGIGVGIDYALLIITRYRAALAAGREPRDAVVEAMSTAGRSVLIAGTTVVISLMGLFLMGLPYLYGAALATIAAVLIVMAASVTLRPRAARASRARASTALRIPGTNRAPADPQRRPPRAGPAACSSARGRPRSPASPCCSCSPPRSPGCGSASPTAATTRRHDDAPGLRPRRPGLRPGRERTAAARGRRRTAPATSRSRPRWPPRCASEPGVAAVAEPALNPAGDAAVITVIPTHLAAGRARPRTSSTHLRDDVLPRAGLPVELGGATAAFMDQSQATADRLPLFIGGVVGLSFLLLLLSFRSVAIALKAGVMNLLSIAAAYGVVAYLAEGGWAGQLVGIDTETPVPPFIPVIMFAVLFGLSMDYEVFLLCRVREEFLRARRHGARGHRGPRAHGAGDHRGGADHGRGVRRLRAEPGGVPQAHRRSASRRRSSSTRRSCGWCSCPP